MTKVVLAVDDSKTMREMVGFTLKGAGFDVVEAGDGEEALKILEDRAIDVIITDINMPRMDGISLVRTLRSRSEFDAVPILVLTTEIGGGLKQEAKDAGATGWMVKPFDPETLVATLAKVCP